MRQSAPSILRSQSSKLFPFLPATEGQDAPQEPDPVDVILGDFEQLCPEQQHKVASNLALLWESFLSDFGGISGFRAAPAVEQDAFLDRLKAAARRMEAAKGSEAAFHYVTVELMRQYISFFRAGSADRKAVSLARCVAPLIDRGRQIAAAGLSGR